MFTLYSRDALAIESGRETVAQITGIGGIFVGTSDKESLIKWYKDKLGLDYGDYGCNFAWAKDPKHESAMSVFYHFDADSDYFKPGHNHFMINFRVDDLVTFLKELKAKGVEQEGEMQVESYGKFAWIVDPAGLKIELWEEGEAPEAGADDNADSDPSADGGS